MTHPIEAKFEAERLADVRATLAKLASHHYRPLEKNRPECRTVFDPFTGTNVTAWFVQSEPDLFSRSTITQVVPSMGYLLAVELGNVRALWTDNGDGSFELLGVVEDFDPTTLQAGQHLTMPSRLTGQFLPPNVVGSLIKKGHALTMGGRRPLYDCNGEPNWH